MCVGQKIKAYISSNGIKQKFLAEQIGISEQKLCLSLNGDRKLSFEEYEKICGCLGVNTDKFLTPRVPSGENKNDINKTCE